MALLMSLFCSGVFNVNFEQISRIVLVFVFAEFEQVNAGWVVLFFFVCDVHRKFICRIDHPSLKQINYY